jgi:hypothetical protein
MFELSSAFHFETLIYQVQQPDWVKSTLEFCEPYYQDIKNKTNNFTKTLISSCSIWLIRYFSAASLLVPLGPNVPKVKVLDIGIGYLNSI